MHFFAPFYDVFAAGTKKLPARVGPGQRYTKVQLVEFSGIKF